MSLPQKLKALRADHHMTQAELGKQINVARATIAGYETRNRQPSYEKLTAIAETFHVSVDYLLDNADELSALESVPQQERILDKKISKLYRSLSFSAKEDVYQYLLFLEQRDKSTKQPN